jgi:hypothetical protein
VDAERLEEGLHGPARCKHRTRAHSKKKKRCDHHDGADWRDEYDEEC